MPRPKKLPALTPFTAAGFGILSRHTVMPWEDEREYQALYRGLLEAHNPVGPVETHLIEELAGVIWRKQRLRQAEAALYRSEIAGLAAGSENSQKIVIRNALIGKAPGYVSHKVGAGGTAVTAVVSGGKDERAALMQAPKEEAQVKRALAHLEKGCSYKEGLAALPECYRDEYQEEYLHETLPYAEDGEDIEYTYEEKPEELAYYLRNEVIPNLEQQALVQEHADDIAEHVKGMAFNGKKLEQLGKYEQALDRKMERTLAVLLKMQDIRKGGAWKPVAQ
jgi:hypothetical protein